MPAYDNGRSPDVSPAKTPHVEKKYQESFNKAMNPPNNPKKDKRPLEDHYNISYDYPTYGDDRNPV